VNSQTLRALRAILETDQTVSEAQRKVILRACETPDATCQPTRTAPMRMLTARDVADMLHVSKRMVWDLAARGRLRRIRLGSRCTRFRMDDVERLGTADGDDARP
jgi:excisionase family DNA binding protein